MVTSTCLCDTPEPRLLEIPAFPCRRQVILPKANLCSALQPEALQNKIQQQTGPDGRPEEGGLDWSGMERDPGMERRQESEEVPVSEQRSLRVAIIGAPNAGKSTLVNQLLQQKVRSNHPISVEAWQLN